jgi:hypothetical protein
LITVKEFDPDAVANFLLAPASLRFLRSVLLALTVPGDFLATLRASLCGTPLFLPSDPDSVEKVLVFLVVAFQSASPDLFISREDSVLMAYALILLSGVNNPGRDVVTGRLMAICSGTGYTGPQFMEMYDAVAATPFTWPPRDLPMSAAPRWRGWGKLRVAKAIDKSMVTYMVMNSLCIFFFPEAKEGAAPLFAVQLYGMTVETLPKENLRLDLVAVEGTLKFVKFKKPGKPDAVSGVKKVELTLKTADVLSRWLLKLRRAVVVSLFGTPRGPVELPVADPPVLPTAAEIAEES